MTCIARTIFTSFSASVHQDVGIRMRRLRGLEYASAATQAQGTAPGSPCWRSSCLLSALTPPFHATRLAALVSFRGFARDLAPVSILLYRTFYLSCFAYLSLPLRSWEPFNPSFFFIIQPSHLSPVTRFLSTHRPFVFRLYRDTLIDKNILALTYPNHGFTRGEYMHDMVVHLHRHFPIFINLLDIPSIQSQTTQLYIL